MLVAAVSCKWDMDTTFHIYTAVSSSALRRPHQRPPVVWWCLATCKCFCVFCVVVSSITFPAAIQKILLYHCKVSERWQRFHFSPFRGAAPASVCAWHHHHSLRVCSSSGGGSGSHSASTHRHEQKRCLHSIGVLFICGIIVQLVQKLCVFLIFCLWVEPGGWKSWCRYLISVGCSASGAGLKMAFQRLVSWQEWRSECCFCVSMKVCTELQRYQTPACSAGRCSDPRCVRSWSRVVSAEQLQIIPVHSLLPDSFPSLSSPMCAFLGWMSPISLSDISTTLICDRSQTLQTAAVSWG